MTELCRAVKPKGNMNSTEIKACPPNIIEDEQANPYKESVVMILKICRSKKHKDALGDIKCECNRAKRLMAERAGVEQPATTKPEEPKALASATCYTARSN